MTPTHLLNRPREETDRRVAPQMLPLRVVGPAEAAPPAPSATRRLQEVPSAYLETCRLTDTLAALAALLGVFVAVNLQQLPNGLADFLAVRVTMKSVLLLLGFAVLWQLLFRGAGLYDPRQIRGWAEEAWKVVAAATLGSVAALLIPLTSISGAFPISAVLVFWGVVIGLTLAVRHGVRRMSQRAQPVREIIIVGSGPRAYRLFRDIQEDPDCRYHVLGFVDSNDAVEHSEIEERLVGRLDQLEEFLMRSAVDEVLIALPIRSCYAQIEEVIRICERVGVESKYLADIFQHQLARPHYEPVGDVSVVALKVAHDDVRTVVKRVIDVVGAVCGLVVLAPLMLLVAASIKLTSPGPVLFRQQRYGRNRRLFWMYKFRTMVQGAELLQTELEHLNEVCGPVFKIKDDPRMTPLGRLLRRTSLDELPQLFNVLLGDMSLVGPRPLPTRDVNGFSEAWLMRRFSVPPGLTCLWQISGRSDLGFEDWVMLDLQYIDRWSLWLDLKILLRTIPAVVRGTGAS